jgi:hypothetical protein
MKYCWPGAKRFLLFRFLFLWHTFVKILNFHCSSPGDMFHFTLAAALSAAALTGAVPSSKRQDAGSVEWGPCEFKFSNIFEVKTECGSLTVPLDYTEEDNGETLDLNLLKVPATKQPVLGSMLFNPGGPGESGIEAMLGLVQNLQILSGGQYDIVSRS